MNTISNSVAPYLLIGIFFVLGVNFFISLILAYFSKIKNLKLVFYYWSSLLITYLIQGLMTSEGIFVALGFSSSIVPIGIISKILFDSIKIKIPLKKYAIIFSMGLATTFILYFQGLGFTGYTLPIAIAMIVPLVEPSFIILYTKRKETTVLQKFMSFQYLVGAAHAINFAIYRMVEGTQVAGFGMALLLYQALSISLLAFSLEEYSREEKERLQGLVEERTKDLSSANTNLQNALSVKEVLLKVVLHDIANPISAQSMLLDLVSNSTTNVPTILPKLNALNTLVVGIIKKVREMVNVNTNASTQNLEAVSIDACMEDALTVFKEMLETKNLKIEFSNRLDKETRFVADQTSFTMSVLNNLISNAIKFSHPGKTIHIRCYEKNNRVCVEVEDNGIGMIPEVSENLFNPLKVKSTPGTDGEQGTGYGLSLVRFYVSAFRGFIHVESKHIESHPEDHGTKFTLSLEKA